MPKPPQPPQDDDKNLWQAAMRDVKKITPKPKHKPLETPKAPSLPPAPKKDLKQKTIPTPPTTKTKQSLEPKQKEIDASTLRKFQSGEMRIESKLDLHGMTLTRAHVTLKEFIINCHAAQMRCVLVVTGKGRDGNGAIRNELPLWLTDPILHSKILRTSQAVQRHGGTGAVYILLKRKR